MIDLTRTSRTNLSWRYCSLTITEWTGNISRLKRAVRLFYKTLYAHPGMCICRLFRTAPRILPELFSMRWRALLSTSRRVFSASITMITPSIFGASTHASLQEMTGGASNSTQSARDFNCSMMSGSRLDSRSANGLELRVPQVIADKLGAELFLTASATAALPSSRSVNRFSAQGSMHHELRGCANLHQPAAPGPLQRPWCGQN